MGDKDVHSVQGLTLDDISLATTKHSRSNSSRTRQLSGNDRCLATISLKPAAHERTCRAYLLFVTSWIDKMSSCAGNIYGIFVIRDM